MALKKKFLSFLTELRETTSKSPEEAFDVNSEWSGSTIVSKSKDHVIEYHHDPRIDHEAIANIDPMYYKDEEFDVIAYNLQKLPEKMDLLMIEKDRKVLNTQLKAVSRRVSELVLENHPAYATELQRVMELEEALEGASDVCSTGRRHLHKAKQEFTYSSLNLLANYRKRRQLSALLHSLHTIKTLQRTDVRLRELLEEEDYPGAIQLCLECQKAASTYRHYTCISELNSKLQDTLYMIDESMDVALSKTCTHFDDEYYSRIQTAYRLMGKSQAAIDQLHMHFISSIQNTSFTKVLGYVELCSGVADGGFQKRQYADLCKCIKPEVFMPCLIDLCKALWEVLKSYHKTINWHQKHDKKNGTESAEGESDGNENYIQQKLEQGVTKIWSDVQQKVKVYLLSTDLSHFKYDEFLHVLSIVNRLIEIGEEFSGRKSEGLEESIRKQSVNYFRSYHRSHMDELRMFLENEGWELCPVKPGFSILMLQEFKFIRKENNVVTGDNLNDGGVVMGDDNGTVNQRINFFKKYSDTGSPFDFQPDEDEGEDVLEMNGYGEKRMVNNDTDSDDDLSDELKQDFIDERTGEQPLKKIVQSTRRRSYRNIGKQPPIITNTTLNVCRLFGKYIQMMIVLQPIAFDVIICLTQLFDYYLYAVYVFFAADVDLPSDAMLSSKLRTTLKRIKENIILDEDEQQQTSSSAAVSPSIGDERRDKVAHPHISPAVDFENPEGLFGLAGRIVATESLMFLTEQFKLLQERLENAIPPAKKPFLQQFYSQTLSTAVELRKHVYRPLATQSISVDQCVQMMSVVKWDIKEIMSQHSNYVDILLQELHLFNRRLDAVLRNVPIPIAVRHALWEHVIRVANMTFVEGFSTAKKCTNEGRALMLLDFQQFIIKLEKLTDLRPIPGREYVETYVKAYYLPETQLETWIGDHKEYTAKHLMGLVNCAGHIGKKSRQKLLGMIEEMDKMKRQI